MTATTLASASDTFSAPTSGRRGGVLLYGLASYAIGVAALVGLIALTFGLRPLPAGPLSHLDTAGALAVNIGLLVLFAVQHSIMARKWFKERWTRLIPPAAERATFVLATGLVMAPMLWLWVDIPSSLWSVQQPTLGLVLQGTALAGWAYLLAASYAIDHWELFGVRQVAAHFLGRPMKPVAFKERWMYRFDRHPIMSGILVGLWATPDMTLDRLVLALGLTVYLIIGVHFEERALRRELGHVYEDYARRVGTLVPTFHR